MCSKICKTLSLCIAVVLVFCAAAVPASGAMSSSQLRSKISDLEQQSKAKEAEIKKLKAQANQQQAVKAALEEKIALTQQQIDLCNREMAKINRVIAANKAEINAKNAEIESDKLAFKKRLRAIYMSNTGSNVQVLLGADDFSQFLELSQLTSSVSARDQYLIEKLVAAIDVLNQKQAENQKLLDEQVSIKNTVVAKQRELQAQNAEITSVINSINSDTAQLNKENADLEKQIKQYQSTLASLTTTGGTSYVYDGGAFLWPVSGFYTITAGFQSNDSVHRGHHNGIDIAGGGINGAPILAVADGVVSRANNSCTHNRPKSGSCGCGGGFGNYVQINHGTNSKGQTFMVTYGHMSRAVVSPGTIVKRGQVIGYVGSTGWSTGYHLHLGIAVSGAWVNPMSFYKKVK